MTGIVWCRELIARKRGAIWIMVGRRRKAGKREPNGRIARTYENPKEFVAAQPHRAILMKKQRELPEAGSNFGRLMLMGKITPAQHEAGLQYASLAARYRAVLQSPPIHPTGLDLMRVSGGGHDGDLPRDVAVTIKARYNAAYEACAAAGDRAQRSVKDHAIFDRRVNDGFSLRLLITGLDRLVVHFGIDSRIQISSRQK
jgi:hypothetical protein